MLSTEQSTQRCLIFNLYINFIYFYTDIQNIFKEMPKYFIVSYRNDLLIAKKLFGKALSLEQRGYSKCEVLEVSQLLSYQSSSSSLMKTIKKVLIKAK